MNLFDILGPIMVGPSSSHTAGAAKIGFAAQKILGEKPVHAKLLLHGSFAATGEGHGTDRALIAGLLGMYPDDERIVNSFELAKEQKLSFSFGTTKLRDAHPNSVLLLLEGEHQSHVEVEAASLGGGRIRILKMDGLKTNFTGDYPTLVIRNQDKPGTVAQVAGSVSKEGVNIATMQLYRDVKGGLAAMVIESDQAIPEKTVHQLEQLDGIVKVIYLNLNDERSEQNGL